MSPLISKIYFLKKYKAYKILASLVWIFDTQSAFIDTIYGCSLKGRMGNRRFDENMKKMIRQKNDQCQNFDCFHCYYE
jgi:hypothetical protein